MTDQSIIVLNKLRGIQSEINRTQVMLEEKHKTRKINGFGLGSYKQSG
jgi:hypothetical protein